MGKIIAVANQKGGVGKTTTAVNMAAAMVRLGYKVLCIDLDPQANMSDYLGFEPDGEPTIANLMMESAQYKEFEVSYTIRTNAEGIDYIPSDITLSSADLFLATAMCKEHTLKRIVQNDVVQAYDYIFVDCLPSLGVLLTNALTACNSVLIPVQAQKYGYYGLSQLMDVIKLVKQNLNLDLKIDGILLTMIDNTNMAKIVQETLEESDEYSPLLFDTVIHKRVEATDSTLMQKSMVSDPKSMLGQEYISVATELVQRGE